MDTMPSWVTAPALIDAIQKHAISQYPKESCGIITDAPDGTSAGGDVYVPMTNAHPDPLHHFSCGAELAPYTLRGSIKALVHSHPLGPDYPTAHDMAQQIAMNVPWGLLMCNATDASVPYFWGDMLPPVPLENRGFRHGPTGTDLRGDCYALIRDWYRANRNVVLADCPRQMDWWSQEGGQNLYEDNFAKWGFVRLAPGQEPQAGDVMLMRYPPVIAVANHAAIFLGNQLLMHQLMHRQSCIVPSISFMRFVVGWVRYSPQVAGTQATGGPDSPQDAGTQAIGSPPAPGACEPATRPLPGACEPAVLPPEAEPTNAT